MDFYEVIDQRRTVRDFEPAVMEADVLERIIGAGMKAPTNDHMRDWHFMVITDKQVVRRLLESIPKGISDEDMEALLVDWNLKDSLQQACYRSAVPKQYRMLSEASAVVIPLLKPKVNLLRPESVSHLNGFASIWCCIENMLLAATAEGYACSLRIPLGDESGHARQVLGFPADYFMPCFLGVGKPRKGAEGVAQKEVDLRERIHRNRW